MDSTFFPLCFSVYFSCFFLFFVLFVIVFSYMFARFFAQVRTSEGFGRVKIDSENFGINAKLGRSIEKYSKIREDAKCVQQR